MTKGKLSRSITSVKYWATFVLLIFSVAFISQPKTTAVSLVPACDMPSPAVLPLWARSSVTPGTNPYFTSTDTITTDYDLQHITRNTPDDKKSNLCFGMWKGIPRYNGKTFEALCK